MAGDLSVESCGNVFAPSSRKASSNYGIGSDGRVGMYVEEKDRSWCSSSGANDHRAVTIEVADDRRNPWHSSDAAMNKLIELCADICRRNGIPKLIYTGDTRGNLTMHKWFAATDCPGNFLESRFQWIADEVNKRLNGDRPNENKPSTSGELYRIRKSWPDAGSQIGAYRNLESAKKECKEGYSVFDEDGNVVYCNKSESSRPGIYGYKVGEHIVFSTCYASSTDPISKAIQASNMVRNHGVITRIQGGARNPYLLDNGLCWVNDGDIRGLYQEAQYYTVKPGDTLSGIAAKYGTTYQKIAQIIEIGKTIGIDLGITTLLGWFVLASLLINEIRSILENFVEAGFNVPRILIKGLEVADKVVNKDNQEGK